jgi:hypothetical protein
MALELVPLCTADVRLAPTIVVSPALVVGEVISARFEGERLQASMKGVAAADWLQIDPAGFGTLDVKITLETDDGAIIHATYSGRLQFDTGAVFATPLFATGDERYQWLTRIQAVAKGTFAAADHLVYEMYELR